MGTAIRFKQTNIPRQSGEQARLKVVQGPDYGATYVITGTSSSIGRGEDADVIISDLKASRKHATLSMTATGWGIKDLGSANGILHNGKNTRTANLKSNDTITLGETTLEFLTSEQATMMLVAPPKSLNQIQADQKAFTEQKQRVKSFGAFGAPAAQQTGAGAAASGGLLKNKFVIIGVGLGLVAMLMMPDPDKKANTGHAPRKPSSTKDKNNLDQYLPEGATDRAAEQFFRAGFREYTAHNYLRARTSFETVLQMNPSHRLSVLYLENANKAIENEVKGHLEMGKKSLVAGRLREARGHFETIMRMLYKDQANPSFTEAKDQLEKVNKEMSNGPKTGGSG